MEPTKFESYTRASTQLREFLTYTRRFDRLRGDSERTVNWRSDDLARDLVYLAYDFFKVE